MDLGSFKPVLASLLMPLALLPLLGLLGLVLVSKRKWLGWLLSTLAFSALWLLSCQAVVVWLSALVLPQFTPTNALHLKSAQAQAIVVLGAGILPDAPEYGSAQPTPNTTARLRYGIWLAKQSGLPLAFSGGTGWAANATTKSFEADVAARVALEDFGFKILWVENKSRDTSENAQFSSALLKRDGITRIALVTDSMHMARAVKEFERTGLVVVPAPTQYFLPTKSGILQWLPSAETLSNTTRLIHELMGLSVIKLR